MLLIPTKPFGSRVVTSPISFLALIPKTEAILPIVMSLKSRLLKLVKTSQEASNVNSRSISDWVLRIFSDGKNGVNVRFVKAMP